jgi:linoleoyl-CoA desaturase
MGIAMAGVGFSVAHDALHGAYSSRPWVNTALGASFDLLGANGYMWQITHNVIHHTYTNIHGVDEDISVSPLLRLSPEADLKGFHRYQHWYAPAVYSLSTLFWVFAKDFKYFLKRDLGPFRDRHHSPGAVAWLLTSKVAYFGYALALPLLVIHRPWWQIVGGFALVHLIAGIILGIVFQLAHVVEGIEYPLPDDEGDMEYSWAVHEMRTTSNFARGNRLVSWYISGLNYQIEHHLFPRVCSVHYPELSAIVRKVAGRHGVLYNEHRTLSQAIASHFRMLYRLGRTAPATA